MSDSLPPDPATLAAAVTALTADVRAAGTVTEAHLEHANALESAYATLLQLDGYQRPCALLTLQHLGSSGATADEIRGFLVGSRGIVSKLALRPLVERHPFAALVLEAWWSHLRLQHLDAPDVIDASIDYCVFVATWWRP